MVRVAGRWRGVRYLAVRVVQGIFVIVGAILVSFILANLTGSPSVAMGGGLLTPEQIDEIDEALGYHDPLGQRLLDYLAHAVHGDFGASYRNGESALGLVLDALPYTLLIVAGAVFIALVLAFVYATYAVLHPDSRGDHLARALLIVGLGLPEFWLGLMLILVFSVTLGLAPAVGYDGLGSAILPMFALGIPLAPSLARLLRGELMDIMGRDFVVALRAKGLTSRAILWRHGLRNALPTFTTFLALQLGYLFGGTLVVEAVFTWPGIGSLLLQAVDGRDIALVQATVVVLATTYVVLNLAADLVVLAVDPRIRVGRA